jgi:hypothetical protein
VVALQKFYNNMIFPKHANITTTVVKNDKDGRLKARVASEELRRKEKEKGKAEEAQ